MINLSKDRVKEVVLSLRATNREILRANNVIENVNDFIYLTLVLNQPIIQIPDTKLPPKPTPVQLRLSNPLIYKDGLLLCKEGKRESVLTAVHDSGLGEIFEVEEVTKNLKSSHLNKYDIVLIHDSIKLSQKLVKRRHFPYPVSVKDFKTQAE